MHPGLPTQYMTTSSKPSFHAGVPGAGKGVTFVADGADIISVSGDGAGMVFGLDVEVGRPCYSVANYRPLLNGWIG